MNKEQIKNLQAEIKNRQKEFQTYCQEQFKLGTKELFEENPELKSFGFKGYVPYFNDGDECRFSARTDYPDINEIGGYDVSYEKDKGLTKLQEKVADFLSIFDNNFYQSIFGSHFEVLVTKDKISVEEYTDHD